MWAIWKRRKICHLSLCCSAGAPPPDGVCPDPVGKGGAFFLLRSSLPVTSKIAELNRALKLALDLPYWQRELQAMKGLARRSGETFCANRLR